jgi:hypothetical protein
VAFRLGWGRRRKLIFAPLIGNQHLLYHLFKSAQFAPPLKLCLSRNINHLRRRNQ